VKYGTSNKPIGGIKLNEVKCLEHYNWIIDETDKTEAMSKDWKGNFVSHCVPKRYEAYCKLLHPLYTDKCVTDKSIMWNNNNETEEFIQGQRIFYKDLAKEYGLQYTKEINTQTIWCACGQVGGEIAKRLVQMAEQ
jgi:hypothetical protein